MSAQRLKHRKLMGEINMIPLIDVMLVLLIVFMVTAPLVTQGIKVDLPAADAQPVVPGDEPTLVVSIDAQGQYYINLGLMAGENPEPVPLAQIAVNVARIIATNPDVPVYLEADASVTHGVVTQLMSTLTHAGVPTIQVIAQPQSGQE